MGLLAKVNMYLKNWQDVQDLTDQIINGESVTYGLVADYSTIWREVGENSIESLFEIQGRGINPNSGVQGYSATTGCPGVPLNILTTPQLLPDGDSTPLRKILKMHTNREIFAKTPPSCTRVILLWDGAIIQNSVANDRYNYKAYVSKKQEAFNGNDWESNKNVRILRMGEVYLLNAEAANELGNTTQASFITECCPAQGGTCRYTGSKPGRPAKGDLERKTRRTSHGTRPLL